MLETTLQKFANYRTVFGARGWRLALRTKLSRHSREEQAVPPGGKHPLFIRLKTSDFVTFIKIFYNKEYEVSLGKEPKTILDAGANVGFAAVYFAIKYPNAKIVAIEPESSNFAQLQRNVAPYPNIIPVQAALWSEHASLNLEDPGFGPWAFRATKNSCGERRKSLESVQGLTVNEIMQSHGMDNLDVLKIDIEGGEKELFSTNTAWTSRVGVIMIELHDFIEVGNTRNFYIATKDFDLEIQRGENVILLRNEYVSAAPARS